MYMMDCEGVRKINSHGTTTNQKCYIYRTKPLTWNGLEKVINKEFKDFSLCSCVVYRSCENGWSHFKVLSHEVKS